MLLLASGESWFNYPGLELWKFVNLAIFTIAAIFVLRKKINEALLARRDAIQQEILNAQQEREQALAKVADADNLLNRLDEDVRRCLELGARKYLSKPFDVRELMAEVRRHLGTSGRAQQASL